MPATFFLPLPFASSPQEPKAPDTPVPAAVTPGQAPAAGDAAKTGTGAQQPSQPQGPCSTEMMFMLPAMLLIMYFLVLRPENRRRKEQQALLAAVKVGDRVVTAGGMHGVIAKLTDKTVTLRIDSVQMTFDRVAIARVERDDAAATPAKS